MLKIINLKFIVTMVVAMVIAFPPQTAYATYPTLTLPSTSSSSTTASTGNVAAAVEGTWKTAAVQVKEVVNNVVFPIINTILAIFFFTKVGCAYFDYRKHGQFEWTGPAILFACLIFTMTAPTYLWGIIGL